jgi:DNA-binding NtrC family response regulator
MNLLPQSEVSCMITLCQGDYGQFQKTDYVITMVEGRVSMPDESEDDALPTVMVVDDDEDVREILGETLKRYRYNVQLCESGKKAIDSIKAKTRVVILDMMMPDMDGMDTFLGLKKKFPGVSIIFYSAYRSLLDQKRLGTYKPLGFIEKGTPGSKQNLLELVKSAMDDGK